MTQNTTSTAAQEKTSKTPANESAPAANMQHAATQSNAPAKKAEATHKKPAVKKKATKKTAAKKPAKAAAAKTKKSPKTANPKSNPQKMETIMTKGKTQFDAFAKEAANMQKQGFDAWMKSATILAKGMEDITRTSMELAQTSAEKQAQFMQKTLGAKTLNELTDAQNKMAQASFDEFMANATKISEMSAKIMTEATEPLNEQMAQAMNNASKAA